MCARGSHLFIHEFTHIYREKTPQIITHDVSVSRLYFISGKFHSNSIEL